MTTIWVVELLCAPVSSSVIVTVTVYTPAALYVLLALHDPLPPVSVTVPTDDDAGVVPQLTTHVCVFWVPTSVKSAVTVTELPRATGSIGPDTAPTAGAKLFTVIVVLPDPIAPDASLTVTLIVFTSDAVPVGLSSRYKWLTVNGPGATLMVSLVPSPHTIVISCDSPASGSENEPLSVAEAFSLMLEGVTLRAPSTGVS